MHDASGCRLDDNVAADRAFQGHCLRDIALQDQLAVRPGLRHSLAQRRELTACSASELHQHRRGAWTWGSGIAMTGADVAWCVGSAVVVPAVSQPPGRHSAQGQHSSGGEKEAASAMHLTR